MKLNDIKRFSAYVRTKYHSEYTTVDDLNSMGLKSIRDCCHFHFCLIWELSRIC